MELTIFTPTYNRANLLVRCYESMKRQTDKGFIWMIIDDGSTDGTAELVKGWIQETLDFPIEYYHKENGGLHTGYNVAISHIKTELCVCLDSDDYLADNAVERILDFWKEYGSEKYAGIVGLDCLINGEILGDLLPNQKSINFISLLLGKYFIQNGDRTIVVRTELYKRFAPMPVFPGEKNFNPHYMHLQISQTHDFLVLNERLKFVEYQPGGMSNSILKQYQNSPNSFAETRKLYLSFPGAPWRFKMRHSIHLVSSCILAGKFKDAIKESPCRGTTILAVPFGCLLTLYIKIKTIRG